MSRKLRLSSGRTELELTLRNDGTVVGTWYEPEDWWVARPVFEQAARSSGHAAPEITRLWNVLRREYAPFGDGPVVAGARRVGEYEAEFSIGFLQALVDGNAPGKPLIKARNVAGGTVDRLREIVNRLRRLGPGY